MSSPLFIIGAMLAIAVLSVILAYTVFRKLDAPLKQRCSLVSAYILAVLIAGYGLADGGSPQFFEATKTYGIATILVALLGWKYLTDAKFREKSPDSSGHSLIRSGIAYGAGFVVVFFVAYGVAKYMDYIDINKAMEKGIKEGISLSEEAVSQDTSNRTKSEKLYDASKSLISQKLEEIDDVIEAEIFAAGAFAGAYARQQATSDFCKNLGVDLAEFLNEFKRINETSYQKSDGILKRTGSSVEEYAVVIKDHVSQYAKQEMNDIKEMAENQFDEHGFTLVDSCLLYNETISDPSFLNELNFSIAYPRLYQILIDSCQEDKQSEACNRLLEW